MKETKTKAIGERGFTYHVEQLGSRQGGRVLARVTQMLGGAFSGALSGAVDFDLDAVGRLLGGLAEKITEENFDYLVDTFIPTTKVSGGQLPAAVPLHAADPDNHFAGAYAEMIEWIGFCLEVNYAGFLPGGSIEAASAMLKAKASEGRPASESEEATIASK